MSIIIHQTLHGYRNGHQLLASSEDIPMDIKKVLLFQSDLSGQMISGFEEYLTGYPIRNSSYYAFAKSWYANEMTRPGCVWTQTLLISLADLGKVPELSYLTNFFVRPVEESFEAYTSSINIDYGLLVSAIKPQVTIDYERIAVPLYLEPDKTIIIPADNALALESSVLKVWSDQWPRLRRNFSFCTGSLSVRTNDQKKLDLQIVPSKLIHSIQRQNSDIFISSQFSPKEYSWIYTIIKTPKNALRKFLWTFGADVQGTRHNYIKLIDLYSDLYQENILFDNFIEKVRFFLKKPLEGKSFKQSVFGKNRVSRQFSEKEIIKFLLIEKDLSFLNYEDYDVSNRLISLINSNIISIDEFLDYLPLIENDRLDETFWENVIIDTKEIVRLVQNAPHLLDTMIYRFPNLIYDETVWGLSYSIQRDILKKVIEQNQFFFPKDLLFELLANKSNLVLEVVQVYGKDIVYQSLDWLNSTSDFFASSLTELIVKDYENHLLTWIEANKSFISYNPLLLLFNNIPPAKIHSLRLNHNNWLEYYSILRNPQTENINTISCIILSKGFKGQIYGSEWIVSATFNDVYRAAEKSKIDNRMWEIIPKDFSAIDDDDTLIELLFKKLLGLGPKKKDKQVANWDNCEALLRVTCDKFARYGWHPRAFLETLSDIEIFYDAISYCLSFSDGREYLKKVRKNLNNNKISATSNQQAEILRSIVFR